MEINKQTNAQNSDTVATNRASFGEQLKQARINKNLSLDDVAGKLYILRRHIEAIEEEDFKNLPQIAFARGFVVNYSKLVGLNPDQMVDSFNAAYPDELKKKSVYDIQSPLKPMGTLQREGGRSWRINPLLILGAIGLIILAVFLIRTISNARDTAQNEDSVVILDDMSDSEQVAGASLDAPVANAGSAIGTINGTTNTVNNTATTNTDASVNNEGNSKLSFWVTGEVLLNVTDATGKSLANGTKPRGGYDLVGKPPFNVEIDDVSKVSLDMDNQPINLEQYAEDNQVNITLPQ